MYRKYSAPRNSILQGLENHSYCMIRGIPPNVRSGKMRSFFKEFIEAGKFVNFHYKHRPEKLLDRHLVYQIEYCPSEKFGFSAVVALKNKTDRDEFVETYNDRFWNQSGQRCIVQKIGLAKSTASVSQDDLNEVVATISMNDLLQLKEFSSVPSNALPNGNVGTTTETIMSLIQQCKFPQSLIKSLGLSQGQQRQLGIYSKVEPDYQRWGGRGDRSYRRLDHTSEYGNPLPFADPQQFAQPDSHRRYNKNKHFKRRHGHSWRNPAQIQEKTKMKYSNLKEWQPASNKQYASDEKSDDDVAGTSSRRHNDDDNNDDNNNDDDRGESYELHEAMVDDPTAQDRLKERLFEEDIELKWEKGGSGLVYYTDAQYWAKEEGGFDEQTADGWDVDMQEFYGCHGDRDAKDFMTILEEERLRNGEELHPRRDEEQKLKHDRRYRPGRKSGSVDEKGEASKLGEFEQHTRGIGRKIMSMYGWSDDKPALGSGQFAEDAIVEPLDSSSGQNTRRGFGYRQQRRSDFPPRGSNDAAPRRRARTTHNRQLRGTTYHHPIPHHHQPSTSSGDVTALDRPCDVARSQHHYALKWRQPDHRGGDDVTTGGDVTASGEPSTSGGGFVKRKGSKLVNAANWLRDDGDDVTRKPNFDVDSTVAINFVSAQAGPVEKADTATTSRHC